MNKFNQHHLIICITIAITILLSGCNANHFINNGVRMDIQINRTDRITKIFDNFIGIERGGVEVEHGQTISFNFDTTVDKGSLNITWLDPVGQVIWQKYFSENDYGMDEIVNTNSGRYQVLVQGQGATGSFNIGWKVE